MTFFRVRSLTSGRTFCVRAMDEQHLQSVLKRFYACTQYQIV
jgi:hypothetical protein